MGSCTTSELPISSSHWNVSAALAASAKAPAGRPTWIGARQRHGHADFVQMIVAHLVGAGGQGLTDAGEQLGPLLAEVAAQAGKAAAAAWTALSTSSGVPSGMVAKTSSVAESMTSSVPLRSKGPRPR